MNERLKQIYAVSLVALAKDGFQATSMRDIASAVGIQTPSLYNYFTGKQDLLFRLMNFIMDDLTERTRDAVVSHADHPVAGLTAAIETFVLFNTTHPHEAAVSDAGLTALDPDQRKAIVVIRDKFDAIFTGLIEDGMGRELFNPGDATIMKNTITSACARIYLWYRPDGRYTPEDLARTVSRYLIAGLVHEESAEEDG